MSTGATEKSLTLEKKWSQCYCKGVATYVDQVHSWKSFHAAYIPLYIIELLFLFSVHRIYAFINIIWLPFVTVTAFLCTSLDTIWAFVNNIIKTLLVVDSERIIVRKCLLPLVHACPNFQYLKKIDQPCIVLVDWFHLTTGGPWSHNFFMLLFSLYCHPV